MRPSHLTFVCALAILMVESATAFPFFRTRPVHNLQHDSDVTQVVFVEHGRIVSVDSTGVRVWQLPRDDGAEATVLMRVEMDNVVSVAASAEGDLLLARDNGGTGIALSTDGRYLAAGNCRMVQLWDFASGDLVRPLLMLDNVAQSVNFSPDGRLTVSFDKDRIHIWQKFDGRHLTDVVPSDGKSEINCADISDRWWLAIGTADKNLTLTDLCTGNSRTINGHRDEVSSVAFSPDGNYVVTGSFDNTIRVWQVGSGICTETLKKHSDRVLSVDVSPDGNYIASGGSDNMLRVWHSPW